MNEWNDHNAKIIEEFRANGGVVGGPFEGRPMILVHHVGAKTGTIRVAPLVYLPDGDRMIIIASKGGAPTNPDWYHNLKANPVVDVEVGTEKFTVRATELHGEERAQAWARVVERMPFFAEYERKTTRLIPVLALTREN